MWLFGIFFGSLDVLWVFFGCSLDVRWMFFGCSLDVLWMFFGSSSDHFVDPRQPSDTDHFLFFASPRFTSLHFDLFRDVLSFLTIPNDFV